MNWHEAWHDVWSPALISQYHSKAMSRAALIDNEFTCVCKTAEDKLGLADLKFWVMPMHTLALGTVPRGMKRDPTSRFSHIFYLA